MPYTPNDFRSSSLDEISPSHLHRSMPPSIVRGLRIVERWHNESHLSLQAEGVPITLSIPLDQRMRFGEEVISAKEYFRRVIEEGDFIDIVTSADQPFDGHLMMDIYWIQIRYSGDSESIAGRYQKKDDGLFAMRTKAGEKAERVATKILLSDCRHSFADAQTRSPGFFEIWYQGKKARLVDRCCSVCGVKFEIKKRNKDEYFRVSHSDKRPFQIDNQADGWHVFVFPDFRPRFVSNRLILSALRDGRYKAGRDRHDAWADIDADALHISEPPGCIGASA